MHNNIFVFFKYYVDEIYEIIVDAILCKNLEKKIKELKAQTPPPMNRMLEKQPHSEATRKKQLRESMPIVDVPRTNPGRVHVSLYDNILLIVTMS